MLYVIGLGLADERDITLKGLDAVRSCERIYLDAYTSILGVDKDKLEALYGKPVTLADRDLVESQADTMLEGADKINVAFLVVGDPFGATTHMDLVLRARERGIPVESIHNASILNAAGCCGLQLYNFGQTVSIPFFQDTWRPDSFYDKIEVNKRHGMHTLCLLDIKVKEQTIENLMRGRPIFEPPRYMTVAQAAKQLLEVEERRRGGIATADTPAVALCRLGSATQRIAFGTLGQLAETDLGGPLHSLVLPGAMHDVEQAALRHFAL